MSMPASPGTPTPPQGTAGSTDLVTQLQGIVRQLSAVRMAMNSSAKVATYVNVLYNGMKGDGITDDSAALTVLSAGGHTLFFPSTGSTYRLASDVTVNVPIVFDNGASLTADNAQVTLNQEITAPLKTIFNYVGSGKVVFGVLVPFVYPEWFGARVAGGDDVFVQRALTAAANYATVVIFSGGYSWTSGSTGVHIKASNSCIAMPLASVNSAGGASANGFILDAGNYGAMSLPGLGGFGGTALDFQGAGLCNLTIQNINNCGTGLKISTVNASYNNVLDNNITIQVIGGCTNGIEFYADNSANVIQGNRIICNFLVGFTTNGVYFNASGSFVPNWNGNYFEFQAVDAGATNGFFINVPATTRADQETFIVRAFLGGFGASGGVFAAGTSGNGCSLDFLGLSAPVTWTQWGGWYGVDLRWSTAQRGNTVLGTPVPTTTSNNRAGFNSGAPDFDQQLYLSTAVNLASEAVAVAYAWTPYSGINAIFRATGVNMAGCIIESVISTANADELEIVIRNVSGGVVNTTLTYMIMVGQY